MTIVGFTGTRNGMTNEQMKGLLTVLSQYHPDEVHHGDCIGADEQFHQFCRNSTLIAPKIVSHPPTDNTLRARCTADEIRYPKPFLERNKDIVRESNVLIAAPSGRIEQLRSGTWSTVRFARKQGIPVVLVYPEGDWE